MRHLMKGFALVEVVIVIVLLSSSLIVFLEALSQAKSLQIKSEIINQINIAWDNAMEDPHPKENSLLSNVFFENND